MPIRGYELSNSNMAAMPLGLPCFLAPLLSWAAARAVYTLLSNCRYGSSDLPLYRIFQFPPRKAHIFFYVSPWKDGSLYPRACLQPLRCHCWNDTPFYSHREWSNWNELRIGSRTTIGNYLFRPDCEIDSQILVNLQRSDSSDMCIGSQLGGVRLPNELTFGWESKCSDRAQGSSPSLNSWTWSWGSHWDSALTISQPHLPKWSQSWNT